MSAPLTSPDSTVSSSVTWNVDRARLLRDATADFVARGAYDELIATRYEALARGFLPQIKREAAIEIARTLAGCPYLTRDIVAAFAAIGIHIKGTDADRRVPSSTIRDVAPEPSQEPTMADQRFFAGPLMDGGISSPDSLPAGHLHAREFGAEWLDQIHSLALIRAAERADMDDFSTLAAGILRQQKIAVTEDGLARMLHDRSGEPAALLIRAIGGDKTLLIKSVQAFVRESDSITATIRHAMDYFESMAPEKAQSVLAMFFGNARQAKVRPAQHFTVQSGQSLHLRATGAAHQTSAQAPLSQRLAATLKR